MQNLAATPTATRGGPGEAHRPSGSEDDHEAKCGTFRIVRLDALYRDAGPPATAAAPRYTFVRIADSQDFAEIKPPVALNDAGQVAFVAILPTGVTGVFVGGDGAVATVADDTQDFTFFGLPGINGRGQATFYGGKADRTGFYAGAGGTTVLIENREVQAFVGDIYSSPSSAFSVGHAILRLPGFQQEIVVGKAGAPPGSSTPPGSSSPSTRIPG